MAEQCLTCRFWQMDEKTLSNDEPDFTFGSCGRDSPVIIQPLAVMLVDPPKYSAQVDMELSITSLTDATRFRRRSPLIGAGGFAR